VSRESIESVIEMDGSQMATCLEFNGTPNREKTKMVPISADGKARFTRYGPLVVSGSMTVMVPKDDGPEHDWPTICVDKSTHTLVEVMDSTHRYQYVEVEFSNLQMGVPRDKGEQVWTMDWVASDSGWI
jgi:hypothetical protein